ncbi:alpha-L-fucosidase [Rhodopirellula sp. SWK7]|nr:alpha-L-fucosidase [Rhodopirellula sp. SWK7]
MQMNTNAFGIRTLQISCMMLFCSLGGNAGAQELSKDALLDFVNTRYQAYFHYNMCTFKNVNEEKHSGRASGREPVEWWNPSGLDCEQWAQVCIDSKMSGGWLTSKHHGGFCLWDSKVTDYDVASSPVKTDVVGEFVKQFRKRGLKVGIYYSILDYHHGIDNGTVSKEKLDFIKAQLTELLTNYGPIDYMNFDGWSTWPTLPDFDDIHYRDLYETVKAIQPDCLIVSHTYESNLAHADVPFADAAGRSYPYHPEYLRPTAASDTSQGDWWWDDIERYRKPKTKEYLLKQLESYNSHNSVYVLNISPGPNGRVDDNVAARLKEVAEAWDKADDLTAPGDDWGFQYDVSENLAFMKPAIQSSTQGPVIDFRARPRAEIAVDGVTESRGAMEQAAMTLKELNPWWEVDLEADHRIHEIEIYLQSDQEEDLVKDRRALSVSVRNAAGDVVWIKRFNASSDFYQSPTTITVPVDDHGKPVVGRTIRLKSIGETSLGVGEVIVRGGDRS